jgi:hypothetical protein
MKQLSKEKKEELLSKLYWDRDVKTDHLYHLLYDEVGETGNIEKINLYCRLLTTYDWYTVMKLLPVTKIKKALSDEVINRLYPKDLKDRFLYARDVLFK